MSKHVLAHIQAINLLRKHGIDTVTLSSGVIIASCQAYNILAHRWETEQQRFAPDSYGTYDRRAIYAYLGY